MGKGAYRWKMQKIRLTKLNNGYYYIWHYINGKKNKISAKTKDYNEALKFLANKANELINKQNPLAKYNFMELDFKKFCEKINGNVEFRRALYDLFLISDNLIKRVKEIEETMQFNINTNRLIKKKEEKL